LTKYRVLEKFLNVNLMVAHVKKGATDEAVRHSEGRKNHMRKLRRWRWRSLGDFKDKWGVFSCLMTRHMRILRRWRWRSLGDFKDKWRCSVA
jgi:hypothetical protein